MPITPTDLSNLWAWYKADTGVTGTGNNVSAWADQSGNGRNLALDVPGNKLKLVASALNGYPAIATLGTPGNGSDWGAFKTADQITATDVTIYIIGKQRAETGFFPYFVSVADGFIICRNGNDAVWFQGDNYSQNPPEIAATDDVFYSLRLRITGGTDYYASINNATEQHDTQTQQPNPGYFYVFGAVDADKEIAEIIIYTESHDSTKRLQVETYLSSKYNLNYITMSNPTTLAANLIPMAFSTDDITFKNAVCLKVGNVNLDIPTTEDETQCGRLNAEGTKRADFDFEIIANTTPNGATEISAATLMGYWDDRTDIYVRIQPGTGMNIKAWGRLYNMKATVTGAPGFYTISGTFKSNAEPTIS